MQYPTCQRNVLQPDAKQVGVVSYQSIYLRSSRY